MTSQRRVSVREAGVPFDKPVDTEPNLELLLNSLDKCTEKLESDHGIPVDHFICIVAEFVRLFHKFGKGLGLALHGAEDVLKSLQVRRVTATKDFSRYIHIFINNEKMIIGADRFKLQDKLHSGSKAIANLNEMLSFILTFLEILNTCVEENKPFRGPMRVKLYQQKLAQNHPLFVQAGVKVLLVKGQKRGKLMEIIQSYCPGEMIPKEFIAKVLKQGGQINKEVYEIVAKEPGLIAPTQLHLHHGTSIAEHADDDEDSDDFGF